MVPSFPHMNSGETAQCNPDNIIKTRRLGTMAAKLPSLGGGGRTHMLRSPPPPLPPLSALLPTSSLNYRPLTFDFGGAGPPDFRLGGGGGHGPQTQYGSPPLSGEGWGGCRESEGTTWSVEE